LVERLRYEQQIAIEQGMLRTGRWQSIDNQPDWTRMRTRWARLPGSSQHPAPRRLHPARHRSRDRLTAD
jgi:hypothetical protein